MAANASFWSVIIFLITYAVIVSEKIHRTVAAFTGAALVMIFKILTPDKAVHYIDFNTIGLLVGMMIIVGITRQTGIFEYVAIRTSRIARGEPLKVLASLALLTAVFSALLDNVTTILLIVPVTLAITRKLQVAPLPFILTEILSSNIGGTATLIGDPPNIMIGSATHLGFMDFLINLAPVVIVIFPLTVFILIRIYRNDLQTTSQLQQSILEIDEKNEIKDPVLMKKSIAVLVLTIIGFALHQVVHLESSVIALSGASFLLAITRFDPEHALHGVEWPVIFFFTGLFIVVGALEDTGVIEFLAMLALETTQGAVFPSAMIILWLSALASSFVDNIPFVATMIPLIKEMGRLGSLGNIDFLWWSLALGACLGGNGTIVGASANLVALGMAERNNVTIGFFQFFIVGFPLMLMSIVIAMVYLVLWHTYSAMAVIPGTLALGLAFSVMLGRLNNRLE
ncbi:SLC13 family permease [Desulfoscipio geothermicus]|uniref:Possible tyrosine transporter P-protein (TC 2.A.45.2.1) n=1 Tax=Desulfoscipio geothermicus DSM 3669 TaxID=1121426 RepID=A0A1I6D3V6_9FIRM|nr:ArsB/NhaD family transporter [Desulfoscipio geothermicus]SFR00070.1 possible tyrosine transporter P-protein (TC 2.A.45.2.1) [Desulfoscipio geothermicus DSM 3669]